VFVNLIHNTSCSPDNMIKLSVNKRYRNPITGLDRSGTFQKFEAPRFQDNLHMKVVRMSAVRTGRLYPPPPRKNSWYLFLLGAESSPACTTVPQPTAPPRTPFLLTNAFINSQSLQPPHVGISHCVTCYWFCVEISFMLLVPPNCITTSTRNLFFVVVIVTVEYVCYCNHFLAFYVPKYIIW